MTYHFSQATRRRERRKTDEEFHQREIMAGRNWRKNIAALAKKGDLFAIGQLQSIKERAKAAYVPIKIVQEMREKYPHIFKVLEAKS